MNSNLSLHIERIVCKPHLEIKKILFNFSFYEKWWKAFNIKVDKTNNNFTFRPFPWVKFKLKQIEIGSDYILCDYLDGFFMGKGIWEIRDLGNNRTNVSYKISIQGKNRIITSFKSSRIFIWKHKREINSLINSLNQ